MKLNLEFQEVSTKLPLQDGEFFCIVIQKNFPFAIPKYMILNYEVGNSFYDLESGNWYEPEVFQIYWAMLPDRFSEVRMTKLL